MSRKALGWTLAGLLLFAAGAAYLATQRAEATSRRAVFVNETSDHKHDRALRASASWFQRDTGINLGIALLPQLPPGTTIETHADALFQHLRLGRKSDGKALLFLWSERERLFKIEVSYDLEHVFPDVLCRRLEAGARTFMLSTSPFARRDFIVELNVTMKLHYKEYQRLGTAPRFAATDLPEAGHRYVGGHLAGGAGYVGRGYAATLERVEDELVRLPERLVREMQPARTAEEALRRYVRLLELGIGVPNVPLLTEASTYFRMDKPHAPGYLQRIHAYIGKAGPARIVEEGDLAVASWRDGAPVLPVFMRRDEQGLWRIDEPKAWSTLHLFQDGSHRLKYFGSPYAFGIQVPRGEQRRWALFEDKAKPPPLLAMPTRLRERLAAAEAVVRSSPESATALEALVDLLHFEIWWLPSAEAVYERLVRLAPERLDLRWRLLDIHQMTSDIEGQNRQLCEILRRRPDDRLAAWHYGHFRRSFYFDDPKVDRCHDKHGRPFDEG